MERENREPNAADDEENADLCRAAATTAANSLFFHLRVGFNVLRNDYKLYFIFYFRGIK